MQSLFSDRIQFEETADYLNRRLSLPVEEIDVLQLKKLGAGLFGRVYRLSEGRVLKTMSINQIKTILFLEECRLKPNPWLPRVHRLFRLYDPTFGESVGVEMKLLRSIEDSEHSYQVFGGDALKTLYSLDRHLKDKKNPLPWIETLKNGAEHRDALRRIYRFCNWKLHDRCFQHCDAQQNNVMLDEGQPIFNDCITY